MEILVEGKYRSLGPASLDFCLGTEVMSDTYNHSKFEYARILATLSSLEERLFPLQDETPVSFEPTTSLQRAKEYYRKRRLRERMFESPDLFADPAWDILIDLFIAYEEGKEISVSSVCIASAVPPTTALRWIKILEETGNILRYQDPSDARRIFISLSEASVEKLRAYFSD